MAQDRIAFPMLEAFLRQLEPPKGGVKWDGLAWPLGIFVWLGCSSLHLGQWTTWVGVLLGWLTYRAVRARAAAQISQLTPEDRLAYERWKRVSRLKKLLKDGYLRKAVPEPVMLNLERTARTWHECRESLHEVAITDPQFAAEIQGMIDATMTSATAIAEPVVRRENQSIKDVRSMEADTDLMSRICSRIQQEEARMKQWLTNPVGPEVTTPDSLRERMERARKERAEAEAELDALI